MLMLASILFSNMSLAQCRVLFMGDSVTDGGWGKSAGHSTPSDKRDHGDKNHIYGHSYMMLCASEMEAYCPQCQYVMMNRGISGDDLGRLSLRWQHDAVDTKPDVMSLLEGTNDVLYFLDSIAKGQLKAGEATFDIQRWERGYRSLLDKSHKANPELKIILCTPFVAQVGRIGMREDYALRESLIAEMAKRIRLMTKDYNATLVDFHSLFKSLCKEKEGAAYWIWDGIHPSPAGHKRMADLWLKTTRSVFK